MAFLSTLAKMQIQYAPMDCDCEPFNKSWLAFTDSLSNIALHFLWCCTEKKWESTFSILRVFKSCLHTQHVISPSLVVDGIATFLSLQGTNVPSMNLAVFRCVSKCLGGMSGSKYFDIASLRLPILLSKTWLIAWTYCCTTPHHRKLFFTTLQTSSLLVRSCELKYCFCSSAYLRLTSAFAVVGSGLPALKLAATPQLKSDSCTHNCFVTPISLIKNLLPKTEFFLCKTCLILPHSFAFWRVCQ